jgi:hypothetical protein
MACDCYWVLRLFMGLLYVTGHAVSIGHEVWGITGAEAPLDAIL